MTLSGSDKFQLVWYFADALTHLILEAAFLYHSLTTTVFKSDGFLSVTWKLYSKADIRWGNGDPTIEALEVVTVGIAGPLCLLMIPAILKKWPSRWVLQIVLCTMELYGGWVTFGPEWVEGSPNLRTDDPVFLWVFLTFANGVWVIIPLILLVEAGIAVTQAADFAQNGGKARPLGGLNSFWLSVCVATLVGYAVMMAVYVPPTLAAARAQGEL